MTVPNGSLGFRWGDKGKWNLEQRDGKTGEEIELRLSLLGSHDEVANVGFPYFGGEGSEHFNKVDLENILLHKLLPNACSWPTALPPWSPPCMT